MTDNRPIEDFEAARSNDRALEQLLGGLGQEAGVRERAAHSEPWTAHCPSNVGLWHELALGALEEEEAQQLESHALTCPLCAADRDLARSFVEEVDHSEIQNPFVNAVPSEAVRSGRGGHWRAVLSLAATVVLAFTGLMWMRSSPQDLPTIQGPGSGTAMRSGTEIELVAPRGTLDQIPQRLSWMSPVEGAEFVVTVRRVDGSVLFERRTDELQVLLSGEERAALQRDVTYSWLVTAMLDEQRLSTPDSQFVIRTGAREDNL